MYTVLFPYESNNNKTSLQVFNLKRPKQFFSYSPQLTVDTLSYLETVSSRRSLLCCPACTPLWSIQSTALSFVLPWVNAFTAHATCPT